MNANSLYSSITNQILDLMESHGSDWTKPWTCQGGGAHHNAVTGSPYHGTNVLLLGLSAARHGFDSPVWGTFKQWRLIGGQVRKGEKGTLGVFYKRVTVGEDDDVKAVSVIKSFFLFNFAQVDGVQIAEPDPLPMPERMDAAEEFIANTGASIHYAGDRACYSPSRDEIRVPALTVFADPESYYSTVLHELGHWTGHSTRLNRSEGMQSRFGDQAYAMEELVAELASAFLTVHLDITHEPRADHAKYLNNWISVLKGDKRAFTTAASRAQTAADYLSQLQQPTEAAA